MDNQQCLKSGLRELALFAGAGGGILGGKLLGWQTVCAVERDPYAASVLVARQNDGVLPPFPIWDDVCTFDGRPWRGLVDVVSGGFPCQDISAAGKGAGIDGERSGLWREMARIIREVGPRYVLVENSPVLTSRGLGVVLGDLASMGYDARWGVLGTCDAGGDSLRERIWIIASTSGFGWPKVLRANKTRSGEEGKVRQANDVGACRRIERIQALERVAGQPAICGGDDGMDSWVDRLRAVGNGQDPRVVRLAWETLCR